MEKSDRESGMRHKPEQRKPDKEVSKEPAQEPTKIVIHETGLDPVTYDKQVKKIFGHPNMKMDPKKEP